MSQKRLAGQSASGRGKPQLRLDLWVKLVPRAYVRAGPTLRAGPRAGRARARGKRRGPSTRSRQRRRGDRLHSSGDFGARGPLQELGLELSVLRGLQLSLLLLSQ